ncbi:Sorting nexin MVP1 [Nakaseomyces bracarensis]|uniref:Sorting nexin MVP1 n=1 Tax=Nakaseomyces bracarensis TaxID=273131 RepID=A0ABR4NQ98_9SACH
MEGITNHDVWADNNNKAASPWSDNGVSSMLGSAISNLNMSETLESARANLTETIWGNTDKPSNDPGHDVAPTANFNDLNNAILSPRNSSNASEDDDDSQETLETWMKSVRKTYHPLELDIVSIEEIPEREGLLFKHANYAVKHLVDLPNTDPPKNRTVIRRYSDFLWLQEVLLKRYPFRMIPDLPPKKIGTQNLDPVFLSKRRTGLHKFINLIMKHPKLSKDDLVLTFLTVPTDISSWRKQASYDTSDEFTDRKISQDFVKIWRKDLADKWNETANSIDKLIDTWSKISILVDRHEKRMKVIANERNLMKTMIKEFGDMSKFLYPSETNPTILDINNGLSIINNHIDKTNEHIDNEIKESKEKVSPKFRIFTDILLSLKNVFERYRMMAANNVSILQKHININLEKLDGMKGKPDASGQEYERIKFTIQKDRKSMYEQSNRAWLIRECILEEFTIFQETQYMITYAFQEWVKLNSKYSGLILNEWESATDHALEMPLATD